jgi:hypothetical protein
MKESELSEHLKCSICHKPPFGTLGIFWVVKCERHMVKRQAVNRQVGLGMMLGSADLASVMGPDEEMTAPLMEPVTLTICEACALGSNCPIGAVALGPT